MDAFWILVSLVTISYVTAAVMPPTPPEVITFPTPPPPPGCMYKGQNYSIDQQFQPTPCDVCRCYSSGQVYCATADCFFVPCVDYVQDPTKCCPTCPNGENCKHDDGTIIKKGDIYKPNNRTSCRCPENDFGFTGTKPICLFSKPQTTTVSSHAP